MSFLKKNWIVLLLVVFVAGFTLWVLMIPVKQSELGTNMSHHPLRVVASFYPLAEFARAVGGSLVNIETITPAGTEPHDYEPTSEQIASVYEADILLSNGGGVDAWATRVAPDVSSHGIKVMEMSKIMNVLKPAEGGEDSNAAFDPHFWLNPVLAIKEVEFIKNAFIEKDVVNTEIYTKNADAYIAKLSALDDAYRTGLASCKTKTVITSHAVFAYLAQEYGARDGKEGFEAIAITGLSPDEEPSAGRLAEIAKLAKEKQVGYIFFETLASPKLAQTLAREIGAKTLVFNPLEGVSDTDQVLGKNYVSIMQENLTNLKTGMVCQ